MRFIINIGLLLVVHLNAANAALIEYNFDTQTFDDGHQITGYFTYDDSLNSLQRLYINLFGPQFNIEFSQDDLAGPNAFSVSFANNIFGDQSDEGLQLFKDGVDIAIGLYGLGDTDICYFDDVNGTESCTGTLFNMTTQSANTAVPTPATIELLILTCCTLLVRKRVLKKRQKLAYI